MAAVVIVSQGSTAVNEARLQVENYKLRKATAGSNIPDLIFSGAGTTAAFLLFTSVAELAPKVAKLQTSFKYSFVLIPYDLLCDQTVAAEVCRLSPEDVSFVFMPAGADFTAQAILLSKSVFLAAAHEKEWRSKQAQVVQSSDVVNGVLSGLPLMAGSDALHTANQLRMLGSLQQISQCSAQQLAAHTGLDVTTAMQVEAFFQRA